MRHEIHGLLTVALIACARSPQATPTPSVEASQSITADSVRRVEAGDPTREDDLYKRFLAQARSALSAANVVMSSNSDMLLQQFVAEGARRLTESGAHDAEIAKAEADLGRFVSLLIRNAVPGEGSRREIHETVWDPTVAAFCPFFPFC